MNSSLCNLFWRDQSSETNALPKRQSFLLEPLEARLLLDAVLTAPDWFSQGPAPSEATPPITTGFPIVPQNNETSGAVQSIAVNPNNNSQIIIGTVNGGVWRTTNASTASAADIAAITWTPLTDQLGSLAIGAVAYDPADTTGNTFYAGTGLFGNAFDTGGTAVGLYRTTDGGATWTLLGNNSSGVNILVGDRIKSIAVSGQIILVGTINGTGIGNLTQPGGDASRDYATLGGEMYRSTDGGATFTQVPVASGLPLGAVTSVVFNPTNGQQVFAAVAGEGVFRSEDGGATWNAFSTGLTGAAASADIELTFQNVGGVSTLFAGVGRTGTVTGATQASPIVITSNNHGLQTGDPVVISGVNGNTAANGSFIITVVDANNFSLNGSNGNAVYTNGGTWQWAGFFSTTNLAGGGTWTALAAAPLGFNPGAAFGEKIQIVADPANANVVYIAGQAGPAIFRYDPAATAWVPISPAQGGTRPHADPRDMVFLGTNTLLEADDGGFYFLQNPTNAAANSWNSFNGNLDAFEIYSVAYDSTNEVIIAGTQDNGSPYQNDTNLTTWSRFLGGDGQFQAVDTTSLPGGDVFRYSLSNNLGVGNFERNRFTNANVFVSAANVGLRSSFAAADLSGLIAADRITGFSLIPFALNSADPQMMMLGYSNLYEDADTTAANGFAGDVITNITANAPGLGGNVATGAGLVTAMAYGGFRGGTGFTNVAVVGDTSGGLWFRGETGAAFTNISASIPGANKINSIALDPQDWRRVYVVSNNQVFFTANITDLTLNPFQVIGGGAGDNLNSLTTQLRTVEVVGSTPVVGGLGGLFRNIGGVWSEYGEGLPSTVVRDVQWDPIRDVLVVGTFGRGAWTIDDASETINDVAVLVVTGDEDGFAEDDTIRLVIDAANPSLLDVFINGELVDQFQLSVIQQINVDSLGGNDTLIVDSTNGLINVINGIRYDGDGGVDDLQLVQTGGPTHVSDTYSVGPAIGSGVSTIVGNTGAGTQVVFFENLSPVLDLVPVALLTVDATASDNAISYSVGSLVTRGLVTIDAHEPIEFANKTALTINAGSGQDTINLNNAFRPDDLDVITINGGDPSGGDTLIVTGAGRAVTVNTATGTIIGATGTLADPVSISYGTIETLNLLAGIGDLTITTTAAADTVEVTPGVIAGSNSGTVESSGAVPQIAFVNSGFFTANLEGGNDALVVNGSSLADTFATVSGSLVAITGRHEVNYSGTEALTVNGNAGSDTFTVTPAATVAMFIDGGDPVGQLPGDLLNIVAGGASVTFNAGPGADEGSFAVGGNQPVSFDHIESIGITGGGSAEINGTNGPDAITVLADSAHGTADGIGDFTVSVNGGPALLFIDVPSLTVNAGSGSDVVTLAAPAPNNAVWNVNVTVNGGTPAADTDQLIVQTPGPAAESVVYTPTASDGGTLNLVSIISSVAINGIDVLSYDGQGDSDSLTVVGTVDDDTIVHTPGATNQAGSFQVNTLLALSYQNLGAGSLTVDGAGNTAPTSPGDTLVYNGTAANDTFTIGAAGQVTLNTRLVLGTANVEALTLEGFAGDDTFTLVPAISASVYPTINLNGGDQASATGDRVFLKGTEGADTINIVGQVVSMGTPGPTLRTINSSGIEDIRLDALGGDDLITYTGVVGDTDNITVSSSGVAGGGQVRVPGVALINFSGVERIEVNGNVPGPNETDTLTFEGTNNIDRFEINLAADGNAADPILRLFQNGNGSSPLLTLQNYTNFNTLRVLGLDGTDTFNVRTDADTNLSSPDRNLFVDGGLPSGKKKSTDNLNVIYTPPRPSIIHSTETQDPDNGIVDLDYGTARFVVQYDDIEQVTIKRA